MEPVPPRVKVFDDGLEPPISIPVDDIAPIA